MGISPELYRQQAALLMGLAHEARDPSAKMELVNIAVEFLRLTEKPNNGNDD
jgi:hypothetical protein